MNVDEIQRAIQNNEGDGWLFFDIHHRDTIAYRILGLDTQGFTTRRWYYFIPQEGMPAKLVHRVERGRLDKLPGNTVTYVGWRDLREKLRGLLDGRQRIFMQYSPMNNIPMVSCVDAGTVESIRSLGKDVLSSAELVQLFEAKVDDAGAASHRAAGVKVQRIKDDAFQLIIRAIKSSRRITEYDVQQFILAEFDRQGLTCDGSPPMVGVNQHSADPHFEVSPTGSTVIKENDRVLIDLWARENSPAGIYYDITWCGFMGRKPDAEYERLFDIVATARNRTKTFIAQRIAGRQPVCGWEADDVCRNYITEPRVRGFLPASHGPFDPHQRTRQRGQSGQPGNQRRAANHLGQLFLDRAGNLQGRDRRAVRDRRPRRRPGECLRGRTRTGQADPAGIAAARALGNSSRHGTQHATLRVPFAEAGKGHGGRHTECGVLLHAQAADGYVGRRHLRTRARTAIMAVWRFRSKLAASSWG